MRAVTLPALTADALCAGPVHVWTADLDALPASGPDSWLSDDERARAARYRRPRDRRYFERRRGWLRGILGAYLDLPPQRVRLRYGPRGQPLVTGCEWLRFSATHADGRVLLALAAGRRIGADLTVAQAGRADDALARALLAPGEIVGLNALAPGDRVAGFHRCWTRKEAYVKARGEGLALPLDAFEVSLAAERWTRLVRCALEPDAASRWRFLLLEPFAGHVASVAIEAPVAEERA